MRTLAALALICALGCGDDDGGTDAGMDTGSDVGDMDTGGEDAPVDADVETTTVRLRYLDVDEAPLADVKVRFDTAAGPAEGVTGADGVVVIEVPAAVDEEVTVTAALEGYVILTAYELPLPVEVTGDTPFDGTLFEISPDTPEMFRVNATGVPTDGRFCVSFDGWSLCNLSDTDWNFPVPPANIGEFANCWLLDATDTPIDFERVAVPEGATSLDVTFDGSFDTAPTNRTVTVQVPADGGPMLTFDVDEPNIALWHGWFQLFDEDSQQMWSVATNLQRDGDDLTVDVAEMAAPAEIETGYASRIFSSLGSFNSSNFAIYAADPGATAATMGLSTVAGDQFDQPLTITPPAPIGGDELQFVVNVNNSARRVFWQVVTNSTTIEMPELPTSYDTEVSFPFPGAAGTVGVFTRTRVAFGEEGPFDFDFHGSQSETFPITF